MLNRRKDPQALPLLPWQPKWRLVTVLDLTWNFLLYLHHCQLKTHCFQKSSQPIGHWGCQGLGKYLQKRKKVSCSYIIGLVSYIITNEARVFVKKIFWEIYYSYDVSMFVCSANTQVLHSFNIVLDRRHTSWLLCKGLRPSLYPAIPLEVFWVAFSYYSPL